MKVRIQLFALTAVLGLTGISVAQSLGEVAREMRSQKHATASKVYTNDEIPSADLNAFGTTEDKTAAKDAAKDVLKKDAVEAPEKTTKEGEAKEKSDKEADAKAQQSLKDATAAFQTQVAEQKRIVAQADHELDLLQREARLRAAAYYADAGNQLRDEKKWAEDERKSQSEMNAKQQELTDAKQKLAEIQEEGRKAGVPTTQLE